jgi:hypothetical protein
MQVIGALRKFSRLSLQQQMLLVEAWATLAMVSAARAVLPFKRAIRLGSISVRRDRRRPCSPEEIAWAVGAAARRLPWRIVCIQKGIAAQRMFRRHGFDATLHYGIAPTGDRPKLHAHVWVTVAGAALVGGREAREFAPIAAYP